MKNLTVKRAISGARWAMYKLQASALTLGSDVAQMRSSRSLRMPIIGAVLFALGWVMMGVGIDAFTKFQWALNNLSEMRLKQEQADPVYSLMSFFAWQAPVISAVCLIGSVIFIGLGAAMLTCWKRDPAKLSAKARIAEGLARGSLE